MTNATGDNPRNRKSNGGNGKKAVGVSEHSSGIPRQQVDGYDASVRAGKTTDYGNTSKKGTPPMGKEKTDKDSGILDEGHGNHMSGRNFAGPQEPDISSPGGAKKSTPKDNLGGGGKMFAQMYAGPQTSGQAAAGGAFKKGATRFSIDTGSGHMFGKGTASPAKPS